VFFAADKSSIEKKYVLTKPPEKQTEKKKTPSFTVMKRMKMY